MMKSAYELAMERLEQSDPDHQPLKPEQKEKLAQIDQLYEAKLAEKEVFLKSKLANAPAAERVEIEEQLRREKQRLNEERETKKDQVRADT